MNLIKASALVFLTFGIVFHSVGQCEKCIESEELKADYCFTDQRFEDYCAQFQVDSQSFLLSRKKKSKMVALAENDSLEYYISLSSNKKYKFSALDLLFIQEALMVWKKEKKDIGMEFMDSGLGIKIIEEGNGESPQKGQKVTVHYTGTLEDGKKFDSSVDRGEAFTFTLGVGQVIKGWDEGVSKLSKGSKALLKIPSNLAYGSRGAGGVIPPDATLYFEVELIDFE